ncbi:hypothetical protein [Lacinutrix sp. Hel_I_90]|uniref:hypothetical protein n=1 Tax=Lacinutrix sp. Hel_I_90 TaxID=1249999 RepID=UPI000B2E1296|nr:hypothetical protein [Lacinutrix sp. Hel_I_90]
MKPSSPTKIIWIIALVVGILGILGRYAEIPLATEYNYSFLLTGFVLLALGTTFKGI